MGTPDFKGAIIIAMTIPSFLIWSGAFLFSLLKLANKKDIKKKFDIFGAGNINARDLIAACISCPIAAACIVIFGIGLAGIPSLGHFIALTVIVTILLVPVYAVAFLIYAAYILITVKFMPERKKEIHQATKRAQNKRN